MLNVAGNAQTSFKLSQADVVQLTTLYFELDSPPWEACNYQSNCFSTLFLMDDCNWVYTNTQQSADFWSPFIIYYIHNDHRQSLRHTRPLSNNLRSIFPPKVIVTSATVQRHRCIVLFIYLWIAVNVRQTLKRGQWSPGDWSSKIKLEVKLMVEEEINLHTTQYSKARKKHVWLLITACVGLCSARVILT